MTTPLFLLRCVQIGLSLSELDLLTIGVVNDMFTEKENDEYDGWHEVAGQADFDAFWTFTFSTKYAIVSPLYRHLSSFIVKWCQITEKSGLLAVEKLKTALLREIVKIANQKIFGRNSVETQQHKSW